MKEESKREIVIDQTISSEYRIVCRFGYDSFLPLVWWCHIEKKSYYRKYIFFGDKEYTWTQVNKCWWGKEFNSVRELTISALEYFDETVFANERIIKKAINLI